MLEPVRIPSGYTSTMATQPINTQRSLETLPNAAVHSQHPLNHSSSEEWSDKDHKDSLQSPTAPSMAHLENTDSPPQQNMFTADGGHKHPHGHGLQKKASSTLQSPRAWMGLQPMATLDEELDHAGHNHLFWPKVKIALKEPIAEFWGTFILVLFGDAAIAQTLLSGTDAVRASSPGGGGFGAWDTISWAWGLGLMLGVYVAGDSGAFLNPAICLASCIFRKLPWRRLPMYWAAEFLGAFVAAGVVYGNYINGINQYEGQGIRSVASATNPTGTAGIFATFPASDLTKASQFFDQFIGSALLVFLIWTLKDDSNKGKFVASGAWFPLGLFFVMMGIATAFGWQTGFAINPARDLGPRVMIAALGYSGVWSAGGYYFWVPIVAPFCGAVVGAFLYDVFIYTGETPVNTPWLGLKKLINPKRTIQERLEHQRQQSIV
ncbi:Aquaporin-3 [Pseudocercospora fuligena]|uniref:Aquaporin-3 n=1 Tax=Pseudocercospora fuligena TaxID=685502 RepID=A0A8H6RRP1_9PEZI|nr:Aquaporin-3 [Pseudocercospora fuligena]